MTVCAVKSILSYGDHCQDFLGKKYSEVLWESAACPRLQLLILALQGKAGNQIPSLGSLKYPADSWQIITIIKLIETENRKQLNL